MVSSPFSQILHVFGSQGFSCSQFPSQFYFLCSHMVRGRPRPLLDHRLPLALSSSPSSHLPVFTPAWAQLRWEPAWCCPGSREIHFQQTQQSSPKPCATAEDSLFWQAICATVCQLAMILLCTCSMSKILGPSLLWVSLKFLACMG